MTKELSGSDLEQFRLSFKKGQLGKEALSRPVGEWHLDKDAEFPKYILRYDQSNICIITIIDEEEKEVSLNFVINHNFPGVAPFVSGSWYFRKGQFTHEIERNYKKGYPTQNILKDIANIIKSNKENFSKLESKVQDCLREAYNLADKL